MTEFLQKLYNAYHVSDPGAAESLSLRRHFTTQRCLALFRCPITVGCGVRGGGDDRRRRRTIAGWRRVERRRLGVGRVLDANSATSTSTAAAAAAAAAAAHCRQTVLQPVARVDVDVRRLVVCRQP